MAFFLKLKNNRFMVYLLALVFSIAIFTPFFYTSANAESSMYADTNSDPFTSWYDDKELIAVKLPNGNVTGYIQGNGFSSGGDSFVFGFIPYEVSYAGETEQLSIELLSSANFAFWLELPTPVTSGSTVTYNMNSLQLVRLNVGWNPDNNTYTNGIFSNASWSVDGVKFSNQIYSGYMRYVVNTESYTGNFTYKGSYTKDVPAGYVSSYDYQAIVQALRWLRLNYPNYFDGGAHVSSFKYVWNVFTQYSSSEGELKDLENNLTNYIDEKNSQLQQQIQNSITASQSQIQNSINSSTSQIQESINSSTSQIQGSINNSTSQIQGSISDMENSINNGLNNVDDSINDMANMGSGEFDDLGSDIDDISNGIGNSNNIIDSVEKPDVDDVGGIVDDFYNSLFAVDEAVTVSSKILSLLTQQNIILTLILLSLVIGLVKYILFGRGA